MRLLGRVGATAISVGMLIGCSSGEVAEPAQPEKRIVLPLVAQPQDHAATEEVEYRYDPNGKPDPFQSFVQLPEQQEDGVTAPLERFTLSQLEITAIIWDDERARALVRDPAGKGYIVETGTEIGKNKGRVISIQDNLVLVKETYVDFRDRATTKEVEMRLYESQEG